MSKTPFGFLNNIWTLHKETFLSSLMSLREVFLKIWEDGLSSKEIKACALRYCRLLWLDNKTLLNIRKILIWGVLPWAFSQVIAIVHYTISKQN